MLSDKRQIKFYFETNYKEALTVRELEKGEQENPRLLGRPDDLKKLELQDRQRMSIQSLTRL